MRAYLALIAAFVNAQLTADQFQSIYLTLFKYDPGGRPEAIYDVLDALFGDVDAYTAVEDADEPSWIDEAELRARARIALAKLEELVDA